MKGTISLRTSDERRALMHQFEEVLLTAAEHRRDRDDLVTRPDGVPECGWVAYERDQMRAAVQAERARRDLPPAPEADIMRAERMATGHCDYVKKFALYCAELAMGFTDIRP